MCLHLSYSPFSTPGASHFGRHGIEIEQHFLEPMVAILCNSMAKEGSLG